MNRREHAVLSLFYDEGHHELTPSFLAYRMRLRASEATTLLDDLVRQGILDLHISDDDGHISYRLPPGERRWILESAPAAPSSPAAHSPQPPQVDQGLHGTDAASGYGTSSAGYFPEHAQYQDDGTDGSIGPTRHHQSWSAPRPQPPVFTSPEPHQPPHQYPQAAQSPSALAPYHGQDQHLAQRRAPAKRNPTVAAALSLIFPGLGQFYNGEFGKGLLLIFSTAFLAFFLLFWVVWIWSAIDAYMVAEYKNQLRLKQDLSPQGLLPGRQNSNTNSPAA